MHKRILTSWLFAALLIGVPPAFVSPSAFAQSSDAGPALGVARISLINGDVTTQRGGDGDWVKAGVNTPLIEGDTIQTGPGSRAEVQLDYSNLIRLDGATEVEVSALANKQFRVRLVEGRITYSELRNGEADVDIETPHVAVRPAKNGRYEIESRYQETTVQVRKGEAQIVSPNGIEVVRSGKSMLVREGADGLEFRLAGAGPRDEWDDWNRSRDDRLNKSESYRYVSSSISGAHELDEYGDWRYVSGHGNVWYPRVGADWAPYRNGRWSHVDYYGWNWIGYEPWGWAPYHYGRWFHNARNGWGWYPGRYRYRHSWRPALVSFFGYGGRGFSLGVGLGYGSLYSQIGWCPLAPGEAYYPWYGRGGRGGYNSINNTTIVNNTNIYNTFRNARVHNGATVVDAQGFSQGRMNNVNSVRGVELQRATSIRGQIPVVPSRSSQGTVVQNASSRSSRASAAVTSGGVTRANAARTGVRSRSTRSSSFDQQRQQATGLVRSLDRPSATVRTAGTRASTNGARAGAVSAAGVRSSPTRSRAGAPSTGISGGTRATAQPSARTGVRSGATTRTTTRNDSGWRRFESSRTGSDAVVLRGRNGATTSGTRSGVRSGASTSRATPSRTAPTRSRSGSANSGVIPRTSRSGVRSAPTASSSSSRFPTRSTSRVPSARSTPSRSQGAIPRASSSRSSSSRRVPSASSRAPSRSSSRIPSARSAPSRSRSSSPVYRGSSPSSRSGGYGTSRSAPSRAPSVRSAPSRSSGGGSVRSAPSRAPSSSPSGGGARSAPSRSRGR